MGKFPSCPIQDTAERKTDTSPGSTSTTLKPTAIFTHKAVFCGIRPQTKRENAPSAAPPVACLDCLCKASCGANEKGQKVFTTHIWQEYLDLAEAIRKTERGKAIYAKRKETIERVFADAKEKHAMRYTYHRGLAPVSRLKYVAMNLKKLAVWSWNNSIFPHFSPYFCFLLQLPFSSIQNRCSLTS